MSNLIKNLTEKYQLTGKNLELIKQINQKTGKELRVESDYCFFTSYGDDHKTIKFGHQEYEHLYESEFGADEMKVLEVAFNPENIQHLLCELDLGVNEEYVSESDGREQEGEYGEDCRDSYERGYREGKRPQTQAKVLSDKWFSLQEKTEEALLLSNPPQKPQPKATLSLWNSGEEGQIQVLTELKEVLENYLNN
jgi:hypothetical protein